MSGDRGQTVLDFVVGMSVFLVAVGFTFSFVPSLLEPYAVGEGATVIVAERGAARLAESSLAGGGSAATLSHACTLAFFDGTDPETAADESDCTWTANANDLHAELGVDDRRGLNLTVTRRGAVGTLDPDGAAVAMRAGPAPPRSESVSSASRIVTIDDPEDRRGPETYRLTLRVW
ncbi:MULTISPECIES: DUF7287 family protein [Halorubrum]|uniref:Uncharacterized protein n=1 Tax=Halorubrum sodomense TaxID=35743 RepID=A0A1I6H761_HALSD|nr:MULTISPECIES: hypothetical protein [Halorubrum]TKX55752.1 hypothetical protein EXE42_01780 [Halorubrum sp. SP3]TKX71465.1 hypothetical protein EXE45_00910 [Halorubrum sp. SP9]SFR50250.1 hypothetical protein SAMN04487937_2517 [Halorubrum sodomense]